MTRPCKECPFRRASAPGYLGAASHDPDAFLDPHWIGEVRLPCHMQVDWENHTPGDEDRVDRCQGLLIMMRNSAKLPHDPDLRKAVQSVERNNDIFMFPHEFKEHHHGD